MYLHIFPNFFSPNIGIQSLPNILLSVKFPSFGNVSCFSCFSCFSWGIKEEKLGETLLDKNGPKRAKSALPGRGVPVQKRKNVSRIQQSFILVIVWKTNNKSDSWHLRETTISRTINNNSVSYTHLTLPTILRV